MLQDSIRFLIQVFQLKAPKKNKMHLEEDDSLTNLAEPESSILTDKDDIEENNRS